MTLDRVLCRAVCRAVRCGAGGFLVRTKKAIVYHTVSPRTLALSPTHTTTITHAHRRTPPRHAKHPLTATGAAAQSQCSDTALPWMAGYTINLVVRSSAAVAEAALPLPAALSPALPPFSAFSGLPLPFSLLRFCHTAAASPCQQRYPVRLCVCADSTLSGAKEPGRCGSNQDKLS